MGVDMGLINYLKKLDSSEKDFLLLAFVFILVALFLIISGFFSNSTIEESKIYVGYKEVDVENLKLNELQNSACNYADEYNSCNLLEDTFIVSKNICCIKLERCCS